MRRLTALLASAACLAATVSTSAPAQIPPESLRIATYNAYLLSPIFKCLGPQALLVVPVADCLAQIAGQTEAWAENLAATILANRDSIDIVALNEIWDEDAKEILVNRLSSVYPVQIRDIDKSLIDVRPTILLPIPPEFAMGTSVRFNGEDSGLMLFAKGDFVVLPLPDQTFKWGAGADETLGATTDQVAFTFFDACSSDDCLSAKGAALIRLKHRLRGPVYNIVLTHMQADYPDDDELFPDTRDKQFDAIRKLIETTLAPLPDHVAGREVVFLLGDLNVPYLKTRTEWKKRFEDGASFFRSPLYETFDHTSSRKDLIETNSVDHERFDYILASPAPATSSAGDVRQRCVQHVTVPVVFRDLESDHNMVLADVNRGFFHCSPAIAFPVRLNGQGVANVNANENGQDVTSIATPGAMQWFLVRNDDETATWSIGPNTSNVRIEVYLPEDLTTPVSRYNTTPGVASPGIAERFVLNQYVLPKRFYIRASGASRQTVANYSLLIMRHNCATKAMACLLQPGSLQTAKLSADTLAPGEIGFQDEAWFRFDAIGAATSGKPQTITLTAAIADEPRVLSKIEDYSDPLGGTLGESSMSNIRGYSGTIGDGGKGYVLIKQASRATASTPVRVAFDTDLRFITVKSLTCVDETNPELGSDDIFTRVDIDGDVKRAPPSGEVEFDCDDNRDPKDWLARMGGPRTKAFLGKFAMRLLEADTTSDDDDSMVKIVPNLAPGQNSHDDASLVWVFDDGKYEFNYDLRRRPNAPVADP